MNVKTEKSGLKVALVGATGAVGGEFLRVLEKSALPIDELKVLASERSAGKELTFNDSELIVAELDEDAFEKVDIAFFTAGADVSREYAPAAAEQGALVIDNSSAFRMEKDVPLIVPEVNGEILSSRPARGIIANPNCATIQLVMVLAPLHKKFRIKRVVVTTFQSVSGAGRRAMEELSSQVTALFNYRETKVEVFPHRIAFNCLPHIGDFSPDGFTAEEKKIVNETIKILSHPDLKITATAVRVPVFVGHCEAVNIETELPVSPVEARDVLAKSPGVAVVDDPSESLYPLPSEAATRDEVFVGRIRKDPSIEHGLDLWIAADNLRKGAALNAVQIAELCVNKKIV